MIYFVFSLNKQAKLVSCVQICIKRHSCGVKIKFSQGKFFKRYINNSSSPPPKKKKLPKEKVSFREDRNFREI